MFTIILSLRRVGTVWIYYQEDGEINKVNALMSNVGNGIRCRDSLRHTGKNPQRV